MELHQFCRGLPKLELHAHLNGSLSRSTMLQLQRYLADNAMADKTDAFLDEFQIGSGDTRNLSDCFQVFNIAHALTSTKDTLSMATALTLKEFEDDGCCYIELRSTPRQTPHMTIREYTETIVQTLLNATDMSIISCLIISINRNSSQMDADIITDYAIEYHEKYPDIVVGIELSGNPAVGKFQDFVPALTRARNAGLKASAWLQSDLLASGDAAYGGARLPRRCLFTLDLKVPILKEGGKTEAGRAFHNLAEYLYGTTLHCGEICNPQEVIEMLNFKPERIGHGVCIHPLFGGNDTTWELLCQSQIPVEICLTSNVNTKSTPDYNSHHFKELYNANVPLIICTDDKGVFATSLSQEYRICAETFQLEQSKLARLSLGACSHIFAVEKRKILVDKILNFINKNEL